MNIEVKTKTRIKALRDEKGLTQAGLDLIVNFPNGTIAKVEEGKRNLSLEEAIKLAEALGVSTSYLSCETDSRQIDSSTNIEDLGFFQIRGILSSYEKDAQKRILKKINIFYS